jgi:hypothetical protein
MPHLKRADLSALTSVATDGVITTARLRAAGLSPGSIASRCRPEGPWQRLRPGVILLGAGAPTRRQILRAAVAWLGHGVVITGADALRAHGAGIPAPSSVHLLVESQRRIMPDEHMILQRTTRLPAPEYRDGLPFAPPARAVLDEARRESDPERLHELLNLPLYWGLCTAEQLKAELDAGNQRGSAAVRDVLRHLEFGCNTFAHGMARRLLNEVPVPPPSWNITVCDLHGRPIGLADAWWDEIGLAWQFGAPHTDRAKPRMNHLALTAAGVSVVRCTTDQLREHSGLVARELVSAFSEAARRARPKVLGLGKESVTGVAA